MAKSPFVAHTPALNILHLLKLYTTFYITNPIHYLHLFNFNFSIPKTPSDTENYLASDVPNITNLMISQYDCAKQHVLRQFNLLNVKQGTEVPSDIHHASVKARVYVRNKPNAIKLLNLLLMQKRKERLASKDRVNIVVLIELYGTIIRYRFLLLLIHLNVKTLSDILMRPMTKF